MTPKEFEVVQYFNELIRISAGSKLGADSHMTPQIDLSRKKGSANVNRFTGLKIRTG